MMATFALAFLPVACLAGIPTTPLNNGVDFPLFSLGTGGCDSSAVAGAQEVALGVDVGLMAVFHPNQDSRLYVVTLPSPRPPVSTTAPRPWPWTSHSCTRRTSTLLWSTVLSRRWGSELEDSPALTVMPPVSHVTLATAGVPEQR